MGEVAMKLNKILVVLGLSAVGFASSALAGEQFCVKAADNIKICAQAESKEAAIDLLTNNLQSSEVLKAHYEAALKELSNQNIASEDQLLMMINREQVDCMGVGPMKCLQVKYSLDQPEWENFYSGIQGFEFEEGNHYLLRVKKSMIENPPADTPSIRYELLEVIDKI